MMLLSVAIPCDFYTAFSYESLFSILSGLQGVRHINGVAFVAIHGPLVGFPYDQHMIPRAIDRFGLSNDTTSL